MLHVFLLMKISPGSIAIFLLENQVHSCKAGALWNSKQTYLLLHHRRNEMQTFL